MADNPNEMLQATAAVLPANAAAQDDMGMVLVPPILDGLRAVRLRSTMSVALQDAQICAPGADRFAVLVSHYTGYLMQVGQIMNGPCCEKLTQHYRS